MKSLLFYTLVAGLFVSVYSQGKVVQNITTFGARAGNDFRIFAQDYVIPSTLGNRIEYVVFPPKGLVNYYTITYVIVKDYNPSLSQVVKYSGNVGTGSITLYIRAGVFRQIDASVEIFGTFKAPIPQEVNDTPCKETTTQKVVESTTTEEIKSTTPQEVTDATSNADSETAA